MVSNVPAPQVPVYLCGARLLASYPAMPLAENVAILSYLARASPGVSQRQEAHGRAFLAALVSAEEMRISSATYFTRRRTSNDVM